MTKKLVIWNLCIIIIVAWGDDFRRDTGTVPQKQLIKNKKENDMKYINVLPYKLKRALSMATIAGATLLPTSCKKDEPAVEQHDVIIELNGGNGTELDRALIKYDVDAIKKLDHDKTVRYIYLTPINSWAGRSSDFMQALCQKALQPRVAASPKVRGRGDFRTDPGVMAAIPTDSLWYVQNGWTFNKSR